MNRAVAFEKLRSKLVAQGLHAIIIPTNDPHFGEYTQDYYKVREWLSGFNGSAGTLVVTLWGAALWTDSRYFVQAQAQLAGIEIQLMKLKMPGTPSVEQWLLEQREIAAKGQWLLEQRETAAKGQCLLEQREIAAKGQCLLEQREIAAKGQWMMEQSSGKAAGTGLMVGYADEKIQVDGNAGEVFNVAIDQSLFSYSEFCSLKSALMKGGNHSSSANAGEQCSEREAVVECACCVVPVGDLFTDIWEERKPLVFNPVEYLPEEYSGESTISKYNRLKESLAGCVEAAGCVLEITGGDCTLVERCSTGDEKNCRDKDNGFAYVVTACDEVAWLCNIRGTDVEYNPVVQAYAVVTHKGVNLFARKAAIGEEVAHRLHEQGVKVYEYEQYEEFLKALPSGWLRICSEAKVSVRDYMAISGCSEKRCGQGTDAEIAGVKESCSLEDIREKCMQCGEDSMNMVKVVPDPVLGGALNRLKAAKNAIEQEGFRKAFLLDGVAWCKLLKYIDDKLSGKGVCGDNNLQECTLSEYEIGERLISLRRQLDNYKGESFEPIVAFGANAALPHYSATAESATCFNGRGEIILASGNSVAVGNGDGGSVGKEKGNFLLMDTGAQFVFGTTDTTRTIPVGELDEDKRRFYTLVLKGMIALSRAKFPQRTRGAQLDILARGPLFGEGAMYYHGTSHGIGHYLCVHEGPQSVRMEENPVPLEPGVVISNEPAIYFAGRYGIRTENVVMVKPWKEGEFGWFNEFETFTRVPIATSCVIKELLSKEELEWLNSYNAQVYKDIAPLLDNDQEREWLAQATKAL